MNIKEILTQRGYFASLVAEPDCECGCCDDGEWFACEMCDRPIYYCYGGDGDELCNNCWVAVGAVTEEVAA
jgi:hypothetical protein